MINRLFDWLQVAIAVCIISVVITGMGMIGLLSLMRLSELLWRALGL